MKGIIKSIFNKLGFQITRSALAAPPPVEKPKKVSLMGNLFSNLKTIGFEPEHIVDIGANHGSWTRQVLKQFPNSRYTLIEPQESLKRSMEDLLSTHEKINFYPVGVGKEKGVLKFTIHDRDDSCSFSWSEEEAKELGFEQVDVPVTTLNDLIKEENLPVPDLIKIDAEGIDLEVLEGCSDFLGQTEVFLVEAGIVNKRIKNSLKEVINYMDSKGYRLFDITDLNRPYEPSLLWLVEAVFVKKNGLVDSVKLI